MQAARTHGFVSGQASSSVSRRAVITGAGAAIAAGATAGIIAQAKDAASSSSDTTTGGTSKRGSATRTFSSQQETGFATLEITCDFDDSSLAAVSVKGVKTSEFDYYPLVKDAIDAYAASLVDAAHVEDVDVVSGASLCSLAVRRGVQSCKAQAAGLEEPRPLNPQSDDYDTATTDYAAIFSPIKVGSLTLRNRIVKSAGSGPWGGDGTAIPQSALDLYGRMADGGVAMIVLTELASKLGVGIKNAADWAQVDESDTSAIDYMAPLVDRIHQGGAYVAYQMGIGNPMTPPCVNDDTDEDHAAYVASVAFSASLLQQAGVDAVEIKGATTDCLNGYLSPRLNHREDDYGPQTAESRTRLYCEMIQGVKEACGPDFPVLTLINGAEENDAAIGQDEGFITVPMAQEHARCLVAAGADLVQVRLGIASKEISCWAQDAAFAERGSEGMTGFGTHFDYTKSFDGALDGTHSGAGLFIPLARQIKQAVDVPVGCACYMDPRTAPDLIDNAVANGDVDLVYMNRPLNVDPELPLKLQQGRRDEVRPCTRCLHCHDSIASGRAIKSSCRTNAAWAHVYTKDGMPGGLEPDPAVTPRSVVVVGGGPAGMEAARVAAQRGHHVTLLEKDARLGGLLPFAAGVKGGHERLIDFRDYLARQLELLGVDVRLGTTADAASVEALQPDAVVVATGGVREVTLTGTGDVEVLGAEQAFGAPSAKRIVLLGEGVQTADIAAYLINQGKSVTIVHAGNAAALDMGQGAWIRTFMLADLYAKGLVVYNGATFNGIVEGGVSITDDQGAERVIACDAVVQGTDVSPDTTLADQLVADGLETYTAGDCVDPWNIQRAVYAGNLAGRTI